MSIPFGSKLLRQIVGITIGSNCASLVAKFSFCYKARTSDYPNFKLYYRKSCKNKISQYGKVGINRIVTLPVACMI